MPSPLTAKPTNFWKDHTSNVTGRNWTYQQCFQDSIQRETAS